VPSPVETEDPRKGKERKVRDRVAAQRAKKGEKGNTSPETELPDEWWGRTGPIPMRHDGNREKALLLIASASAIGEAGGKTEGKGAKCA